MTDKEARVQTIGGWYKELGVSGSGDKMAYLYDMNPGLQYVIATVYEEDFDKLPPHLATKVMNAPVNEVISNPEKAKAENTGMLELVDPEFRVVIDPHRKGKHIDWEATGDLSKQAAGGGPSGLAGQLVESYVWEELSPEQWERAASLAGDVVGLQWGLAKEVIAGFAEIAGVEPDEVDVDAYASLIESVQRGASYDFAKLWPSVRGASIAALADLATLDKLELAVRAGKPEDLTQILADNHPLVIDAAFAKVIFKSLGETGVAAEEDDRVLQAKRAALYVELTNRHGVTDAATARGIVEEVYDDEVPF
jgi:hypothetical protein